MTVVDVYELADRLYQRLRPRLNDNDRRELESLMKQDMQVAAGDLVVGAMKERNITLAELAVAINLARAGKFLKLSDHLLQLLLEYQRTHAVA